MGLDTTHNAWHGAYSRFHRWRVAVANAIGINIDEMEGFGGTKDWDQNHPLTPLLHHSDCDGDLSVEECKRLIIGLTEIKDKLEPEWKERAEQFIKGCQDAIEADESIEFH